MIVEAYAAGDRAALRPLLSDDTYRGFDAAVTAREAAGETQRTEIRAINTVAIEAAALRDNVASITVRFVSDQVNETLDRDGKPVALALFNPDSAGRAIVQDTEVPTNMQGVAAFAVTEEPASGSAQPTTTPFLVGAVPR